MTDPTVPAPLIDEGMAAPVAASLATLAKRVQDVNTAASFPLTVREDEGEIADVETLRAYLGDSVLALGELPKPWISPSQIRAFKRCARAWYYRYVLGYAERPKSYLILGSTVHAALEYGDVEQLAGAARPRPAALANMAADLIEPEILRAEQRAAERTEYSKGDSAASMRDDAYRLSLAYEQELGPQIRPVLVEQSWELPDAAGPGRSVKGRLDVLATLEGDDRGTGIIDRKTGKRSPGALTAIGNPARRWYTMGARSLGHEPAFYDQHHMVRTKAVKIVRVRSGIPDQQTLEDTLADAKDVATSMRTGLALRTDDMQVCGKCDFLAMCRPEIAAALRDAGAGEDAE